MDSYHIILPSTVSNWVAWRSFLFIRNLGFLISIIPPGLVLLMTLGLKRGLLLTGGLIRADMFGDQWPNRC